MPKDALSKTAEISKCEFTSHFRYEVSVRGADEAGIAGGDLNTALALHVDLMTVASGDVSAWAVSVPSRGIAASP